MRTFLIWNDYSVNKHEFDIFDLKPVEFRTNHSFRHPEEKKLPIDVQIADSFSMISIFGGLTGYGVGALAFELLQKMHGTYFTGSLLCDSSMILMGTAGTIATAKEIRTLVTAEHHHKNMTPAWKAARQEIGFAASKFAIIGAGLLVAAKTSNTCALGILGIFTLASLTMSSLNDKTMSKITHHLSHQRTARRLAAKRSAHAALELKP